mmetsp:Transcript_34954/g.111086  ORF Transcript_34954/g.111086 Transcript_34954/m.111086 type:complete len:247 (-) Transcript_34954:172-912(-)
MRERFAGRAPGGGVPPLILVGFSFGGPSAWAAAAAMARAGEPPCGVVALAGSGRGGAAFEREDLDTLGCIEACANSGVRTLLLHGTNDKNVDVNFAHHCFHFGRDVCSTADAVNAGAKIALVVLAGSPHMLDVVRCAAYTLLKSWVLSCLVDGGSGVSLRCDSSPRKRERSASLASGGTTLDSLEASAAWLPHQEAAGAAAAVLVRGSGGPSTLRIQPYKAPAVSAEDLRIGRAKGYSEKGLDNLL